MSLCFLCNGNNYMVSHIINSFKENEKQHLFNDIVRFVCSKKQMNYNMYQQEYSGKVIAAEERNSRINELVSSGTFVCEHSISAEPNATILWIGSEKNHTLLQAKQELRIIKYAFNYFFPIYQKSRFGESHQIDSSEFLNFFLYQISSDLGDKSYMNFGFNIQYRNTCNQCKSTKFSSYNQNSSSHSKILDVPLPFETQDKPEINLKKVINDMFRETQVKDYHCEKCNRKDLTMKRQSSMIRLPNVMIFSSDPS